MTSAEALPTPPEARRADARRRTAFVAVALFMAAALVRAGLVDRHGLWVDELFSLAMATGHSLEHPADKADPARGDFIERPTPVAPAEYAAYLRHDTPPTSPARVVRAVRLSDTSPPLYYLALYGWTRAVGTSDAALRLFSLGFALAALPVVWSVARQTGGRRGATAACVVYAFAPACVYYSTEGRMYALLWFLSACLLWLTLRLHATNRRQWLALAGLTAVSVTGLLTHYFFAFVLSAAGLWLLVHPGRLGRARAIAGGVAIVALVLPWYARLPESLGNWRVTGDWLSVPPYDGYNRLLGALLLPWQFVGPRGVWGVRAEFDWLAAAVFATVVGLAVWRSRAAAWVEPRRQLLWLTLAAGCLGPLLFDLWRGTYVTAVPRYAIATLPAAMAVLGFLFGQVRRPALRVGLLSMLVLASLFGVRRMYLNGGRNLQPMRQAGAQLAAEARPGDLVLVHSIPSGVIGIARYLTDSPTGVSPGVGYAGWVGQLDGRRVPEDLRRLLAGRRRVFVVLFHEVGEPAPELDWLRANTRLDGQYVLETVRVFRFVPSSGETFTADK